MSSRGEDVLYILAGVTAYSYNTVTLAGNCLHVCVLMNQMHSVSGSDWTGTVAICWSYDFSVSHTYTSTEWEKCEHTDPHTHTHTPNHSHQTTVCSERERGRETDSVRACLCVWQRHKRGSCQSQREPQRERETDEKRSTCQSGWALNCSKRAAEWVQTAWLHAPTICWQLNLHT